jgi:hypothetical protein
VQENNPPEHNTDNPDNGDGNIAPENQGAPDKATTDRGIHTPQENTATRPQTSDEHPVEGPPPPTPIQADYLEPALEALRKSLEGNSPEKQDIQVLEFQGHLLDFFAETQLTIHSSVSNRTVAGKANATYKLNTATAVREATQRDIRKVLTDQKTLHKIRAILLEFQGQGYGLEIPPFKLNPLTTDYVHYVQCVNCKAQGKLPCQNCAGKGKLACPRCNTTGFQSCTQCNGAKQIRNAQGKMQPCTKCNGHGRIGCNQCQQTKFVGCTACNGQGNVVCSHCNGLAWNSVLSILEHSAKPIYNYDRTHIPEHVQRVINTLGPKLAKYADIEPLMPDQVIVREEYIIQPYHVKLPYADATFMIGDLPIKTLIGGQQSAIWEAPAFLMDIMKPGIERLNMAAAGQGTSEANLKAAAKYRTLRQTLIAAAKYTEQKAAMALLKSNPNGLNRTSALSLIQKASQAMDVMTQQQRQLYAFIGVLAGISFFTFYILTPPREILMEPIDSKLIRYCVDFTIFFITAGLTYTITRKAVKRVRQQAVGRLFSSRKKRRR